MQVLTDISQSAWPGTRAVITIGTYDGVHLGHRAVIMHPGPINRGVELSTDAADSPQSIILDQVENGVAVRMAVLYLLANQLKINT